MALIQVLNAARPCSINDFPPELLSRIFTIGCEAPLLINKWTLTATIEVFPSKDPTKRLPKDFTRLILQVCRRWRTIANMKSNSHLYCLCATLFTFPGMADTQTPLSQFFKALQNSDGCDIDLIWNTEAFSPNPLTRVDFGNRDENAITIMLLMHGLCYCLKHFSRQVKSITARLSSPTEVALLCSLLKAAPMQRLEWLAVTQGDNSYSWNDVLHPQDALETVLDLYDLPRTNNTLVCLDSLIHIGSNFIPFWDQFRLPSTLLSLSVFVTTPFAVSHQLSHDWDIVTKSIRPLVNLIFLRLDFQQINGVPKSFSPFCAHIRLPYLKLFEAYGKITPIVGFLIHLSCPRLLHLSLKVTSSSKVYRAIRDVFQGICMTFSSVTTLWLECRWPSVAAIWKLLRLPNLRTLRIRGTYMRDGSRDALHHHTYAGKGPLFAATDELEFIDVDPRIIVVILCQMDLTSVTTMSINGVQDDTPIEDWEPMDESPYFTDLRYITFTNCMPDHINFITSEIEVSRNCFLVINGLGNHANVLGYPLTWPTSAMNNQLLASITFLETDLVEPYTNHEHPLTVLPTIEYLVINIFSDEPQALEWLILPEFGVSPPHQGHEVLLPHLRSLWFKVPTQCPIATRDLIVGYVEAIIQSRTRRGFPQGRHDGVLYKDTITCRFN